MRRTRLLLAPIVALVFTLVISSQFCMPVAGVWPGSGSVTLNNGVISVTHEDSYIGYVQYPVGYNLALWTFGGGLTCAVKYNNTFFNTFSNITSSSATQTGPLTSESVLSTIDGLANVTMTVTLNPLALRLHQMEPHKH